MKFKKHIGSLLLFAVLAFFVVAIAGLAEAALPGATPVGPSLPASSEIGLSELSIKAALTGILKWLLGVVGIIALISFVISGIMYFIAAGDDKMVEKAKKGIAFSIIGVVVVLGSLVVIQTIEYALKGALI